MLRKVLIHTKKKIKIYLYIYYNHGRYNWRCLIDNHLKVLEFSLGYSKNNFKGILATPKTFTEWKQYRSIPLGKIYDIIVNLCWTNTILRPHYLRINPAAVARLKCYKNIMEKNCVYDSNIQQLFLIHIICLYSILWYYKIISHFTTYC